MDKLEEQLGTVGGLIIGIVVGLWGI